MVTYGYFIVSKTFTYLDHYPIQQPGLRQEVYSLGDRPGEQRKYRK